MSKKLIVLLALGFMLGACDPQQEIREANEIVDGYQNDCLAGHSNRHLGNFACAFETFGRILAYPFGG